jgi:anti-sigma-K factor RskA
MSETSHERWSEELAAYLLGALKPSEAESVEQHLAGCSRCREEVRWLMPALDALPETVERLEAPPQLRERLLATVREEAGVEPEAEPRRGVLERLRDAFTGPHWRPLVAGTAVLLIAAVVAGYVIGSGGSGGGSNGGELGSTVGPVEQESGIVATVTMDDQHGRITLSNVPNLPPDRVLEAWVEREGEIEPVPTLFVPNGEGQATTSLGDMRGVHTVMVTTEPPGGSKAPTSTPIAAVKLPRT